MKERKYSDGAHNMPVTKLHSVDTHFFMSFTSVLKKVNMLRNNRMNIVAVMLSGTLVAVLPACLGACMDAP